ncbi:hypothetical protein PKOR_01715 [Pontibacter korlensis]|uniref:Uncharacterized protein n=1 Tax=Pontibacter korlensis TaxID=400092 RepID=A0A0E3ZD66_9BACT|nr:hypothetical protein PKOR_01715 [Pontibacter korlensis]
MMPFLMDINLGNVILLPAPNQLTSDLLYGEEILGEKNVCDLSTNKFFALIAQYVATSIAHIRKTQIPIDRTDNIERMLCYFI